MLKSKMLDPAILKYNIACCDRNLMQFVDFAAEKCDEFLASKFISQASTFKSFPYLKLGDLKAIADSCGGHNLKLYRCDNIADLQPDRTLIFVNRGFDVPFPIEAGRIVKINDEYVTYKVHSRQNLTVTTKKFKEIFTGFIFMCHNTSVQRQRPESLQSIVQIIPDMFSGEEKNRIKEIFYDQSLFSKFSSDCVDATDSRESGTLMNVGEVCIKLAAKEEVLGILRNNNKLKKLFDGRLVSGVDLFSYGPQDECPRRFDNGVNLGRRWCAHLSFFSNAGVSHASLSHLDNDIRMAPWELFCFNASDNEGRTNWKSEWQFLPDNKGETYRLSFWIDVPYASWVN